MAKVKIIDEPVSGANEPAGKVEVPYNYQTMTDAPVIVFNGKFWETPDGRRFNTRLKAEREWELGIRN
jgi:hypothetical protein